MTRAEPADPAITAFADDVGFQGPVAVVGGGTRWEEGGPMDPGTRLVTAPTGIVDYQPAEMVVTVRAGTSVAELQATLSEHGQITALPERHDPTTGRDGTVGGAVAVGENRLDRLGRGSVRDAVLQVRYVSAEGQIVTGGGPVVKNVSGYNLPKVMVGSLGCLGLLAELVLRTNPIPPVQRWLVGSEVSPGALWPTVYRPGAVLWDGHKVWVLLEGHGEDVDDQQRRLAAFGQFSASDPPELPPYRHRLTPAQAAQADQRFTGRFMASLGVGTVFADQPPTAQPVDATAELIARRAKALFDPTGRLNPGRFPGR